jgi:hypothetical protein
MDPTECLKQLLLAIADGDREDTMGYLQDLNEWLEKGGVLPDVNSVVLDLADSMAGDDEPEDDEEGDDEEEEEGVDEEDDTDPEDEPEAPAAAPARRRTKA